MAKKEEKKVSNQKTATELRQDNKSTLVNESKSSFTFIDKYPLILLSAIVMLLYMGSINFGFTELDDTIFIRETQAYNADISNLSHSFKRGVFSEGNDTYYRPMLLNSFIINHALSDTNVKGYHAMNLLFHLIAVLLLFLLFKKLNLNSSTSFLLTCVFAVHPVLSQAVAWIPGRNDTLLAIFSFAFMIFSLNYFQKYDIKSLALQFIFLLAALFTKETAVFVAPAFLFLCFTMNDFKWLEKKKFLIYGTWVLAGIIWFMVRSMATLKHDPIQISEIAKHFLIRTSLSIQYIGKIILPFNLSVFPMLNETTYIFGIVAIILLAVGIYFSKEKSANIILAGLGWFFLFLIPLFILPSALNDQDFEHRLYLPIVGVLLILSQSFLFKNFNPRTTSLIVLGICAILFGVNMMHQQKFKDPVTFWSAAIQTTPKSAYANMMLAARLKEIDSVKAYQLMHKAYQLNPKEKYVNYYLGKDYLNKNMIDSAEKYLMNELTGSKYYDTYFLMSRVAFLKNDTTKTLSYMEQYLELDPTNSQAINNYVLMLTQSNQWEKAKIFVAKKQTDGVMIPKALVDLANSKGSE